LQVGAIASFQHVNEK